MVEAAVRGERWRKEAGARGGERQGQEERATAFQTGSRGGREGGPWGWGGAGETEGEGGHGAREERDREAEGGEAEQKRREGGRQWGREMGGE